MRVISRSPGETEDIGWRIGRLLGPGMLVKLYGDLGAGKTTMVKGIARAFNIPREDVVSPTYTIITAYAASPAFFHADLYRISGGRELEDTGIWDCIGGDAVTVVEWPENAEGELPDNAVVVRLGQSGPEERFIEIEGIDEKDWNNLQA